MSLEAFGSTWKFSAPADRSGQWSLQDTRRNEELIRWGWAKLNNISESNTVSEKCRFHSKLDNAEVAVEQENVYPFGGESLINRALILRDKLAEIRLDVKPGRGESVRNFELETLTFPGNWQRIEIVAPLPAPGEEWQLETLEIPENGTWESAEPFAVLLLTDEDNFQLEVGIGGDWWRMLGEGNTLWQLTRTADHITLNARLVSIPEDAEVFRRPWRFNYYLSWGRKNSAVLPPANDAATLQPDLNKELHCECFRAPAVRKYLRKLLRQQQSNTVSVVLQLPAASVCDEAGHLERPGKKTLRHGNLDELFALYSWGNRTLGEGRELRIELPGDSLFRKLPSGRYLSNPPGEASVREI